MSSDESESDYESDYTDNTYTDSDTASDSDSSIAKHLQKMSSVIQAICDETENLENRLESLQRPIEAIAIEQFGDTPFHESSPFRKQTFAMQSPCISGIDTSKRYSFEYILSTLRNYLMESDAVAQDGSIHLSKDLKKLFGVQKTSISYIELIGYLRKVLV